MYTVVVEIVNRSKDLAFKPVELRRSTKVIGRCRVAWSWDMGGVAEGKE